MLKHKLRLIEEVLGCNCEEFSFVCRSVGIKKRSLALFSEFFETQKFTRACFDPVAEFSPVFQRGRSVSRAVKHIQFMSEFVVNNIVAGFRMAATSQGCIPYNNYRPALEGLPENSLCRVNRCGCIFKETRLALGHNK